MQRLTHCAELAERCRALGAAGSTIGFVPTMGALHDGHLELVRRARAENDTVVVSIFVNPLQFGAGEDYESYPRHTEDDAAALAEAGVDVLAFTPAEEMYPPGHVTRVSAPPLADVLEGAARPGFFTGVLTVVAKLLNLTRPTRAYFGRKDYQQSVVVRRMVADLDMDTTIVVCDTVREPDGLAMSSRNGYLDAEQRVRALCLVDALGAANRALGDGQADAATLTAAMTAELTRGLDGAPDYAVVVDPHDLTTRTRARAGDVALVAGRVGRARLIDNHVLGTPLGPFARGTRD